MKRIALFLTISMVVTFVYAQGDNPEVGGSSLRSDTTFMCFRTDHLWDTVDETDLYYLFPARPDSGLHFVYPSRRIHQPCTWDSLFTQITVDTFVMPPRTFYYENLAQKMHTDSVAQLYGIAITVSPTNVYSSLSLLGGCLTVSEFEEPFDKEITQYRYNLLRKGSDGTDSVMEMVDSLWLDKGYTIKKCWIKYHIDYTDTTEGNYLHYFGMPKYAYIPGVVDVVVPCYEIYFDDPFDTMHLVNGDFYVGRTNLNTTEKFYYEDKDRQTYSIFYPQEFYPIYNSDDSVIENHIFRYDNNGKIIGMARALLLDDQKYLNYHPWGLVFPITGLRCGQLHNVQLAEKGEAYVLWTWQGGEDDDDSQYQVRLIDNNKGDGGIIASDFLGDTSYMFTNLDEYGDYTFKIRKRCHYATTRYDTVVWSDWYSYPFKMKENPVDTTIVDTNIVDTTIVDTTGIRLALGDADFSVSPNPVHGSAVVRLQYAVTERGELTLYDMRGREVLRRPLERGMREVRLDLEDLPAGAYMLKVLTPRGLCSQRLLVQ